jgi:hypothetical protein
MILQSDSLVVPQPAFRSGPVSDSLTWGLEFYKLVFIHVKHPYLSHVKERIREILIYGRNSQRTVISM